MKEQEKNPVKAEEPVKTEKSADNKPQSKNLKRLGGCAPYGLAVLAGVGTLATGMWVADRFSLRTIGSEVAKTPTPVSQGLTAEQLAALKSQGFTVVMPTATLTIEQAIDRAVATAVAKIAEVKQTPTSVVESTEKASKTLPKPAAWDKEPVIDLSSRVGNLPAFPKTKAEAASTFGIDPETRSSERWEKNPDGGWHYGEGQERFGQTKNAKKLNAQGFLVEFYYDIQPGKNPYCAALEGLNADFPAQGATFWDETGADRAKKLQAEMAVPKWKVDGQIKDMPCEIISPKR